MKVSQKPIGGTLPIMLHKIPSASTLCAIAVEEAADEYFRSRSAVLNSLQQITEEFVRQVGKAQGLAENIVKNLGGKIVTFGSFKLGVIGPGSDIDTLVVCPSNVTIEDFFATFPEILQKMAPAGSISELTLKPDAFAPIITLKYNGVDLDLLFGRIAIHNQIKKDLVMTTPDLLRGLTDQEVRQLNGVRVAEEMLSLVPEQGVFRTALRAIKLWSSRRAIVGNIFGFPGGVVWAILVARICQLYPKATASTVVFKFFNILKVWRWPMPVILKPIDYSTRIGNLKVWNPKVCISLPWEVNVLNFYVRSTRATDTTSCL
jgi:poly(A) polymerase